MTDQMNYARPSNDEVERRLRHWLQDELELDGEAIEMVLHLRRQVVLLQSQLAAMEIELDTHRAGQQTRLRQFRQSSYEVEWEEIIDPG